MNQTDTFQTQRRTFQAGLAHLAALGRVPQNLTVSPSAHPVLVLKAEEIVGRVMAADKQPTSVQFSASDSQGNFAVGEVSLREPSKIISMRYGAAATSMANKLQFARLRNDVALGDAKVQILRVPELSIDGVSLDPKTGQRLFLTFSPAPNERTGAFVDLDQYVEDVFKIVGGLHREPNKPSTLRL